MLKLMSGPTFSPDGKWMWNGSEWIPAPPQSDVVPTENLDKAEIESVANETGVESETLANVAPYFDENRDGELQRNEIQQAAMSLANQPITNPPKANINEAVIPQQPMAQPAPPQGMQHQTLPQPAAPQGMQHQTLPQPAPPQGMQHQTLPQPAPPQGMQHQTLPQPIPPQEVPHHQMSNHSPTGLGVHANSQKNKSRIKILAVGLVFLIVFSTVMVIYFKESDFGSTSGSLVGLSQISDDSINSGDEFGASKGSNDVIGSFRADYLDLSDQSFLTVEMSVSVNGANPIYCSLYEGQYASPDCKVIWNIGTNAPTYSGSSIYESQQNTGAQDVTALVNTISQTEQYCRSVSANGIKNGESVADHAFCFDSFIIVENGVDVVSSASSIFIVFEVPGSSQQKQIDYFLPLLDYDSDGIDDYIDECPLESGYPIVNGCLDADSDGVADKDDDCPMTSVFEDADEDGCSENQRDEDNDGIPNNEDLLQNGNAGLRIYVSQLHIIDGELYEDGQIWACKDNSNYIYYAYINDGVQDCTDGSDEAIEAGEQGVHYRIPDFTYRLKVDWNCDEIYDETIDMANEGAYYPDVEYLNMSLDAATQNGRVLNKDIADDLDSVCVAINVFDVDVVGSGELESLDVTEIEGTGQSFTLLIGNEAFDGDYTWTKQGTNDDDSVNGNADAKVSIRFLIYEV